MPSILIYKRALTIITILITLFALQLVGSAEKADDAPVPASQVVGEEQEKIDGDTDTEEEQDAEDEEETVVEDGFSYRVSLMNATELNPTDPGSEDLDIFLEEIMCGIIDDDMTTYEKTKASYDYIVANTRYGSHASRLGTPIGNVTAGQISSNYGVIEGYGAVVLGSNVGMCNAYSSAFILMVRDIGLEARLVKGSTRSAGGGYAYHEWAEIIIDGVAYVFDPQLEQNLTSAGLGTYNVFFKTYDQIPGRYIKNGQHNL